ncbi:SDR family oxidoreductase [Saccharopolyspora sp. S2-29]|uniref:SDR family oxidoreductase n=1 Tax=Saccharopolyspora mangrovi TaxID=3082379 RepID=A0ABU6AAL7_9PSEU|nr:SDR family NAD(P)-dependent oxidoreductase [Saccharopolyspora sp. S2-29]MEB3368618.1 SDR family oxidoreductase [Saccharopolyspora sp. S2-29]
MEATGRRILVREADVRDSAALTSAADEGAERFGRLDIVLANAGIFSAAPTFTMRPGRT